MLHTLITLFLQVLVLLVIVPACTSGGVAVREGGLFRGFLAILCIALLNFVLWVALTFITVGFTLVAQVATFGLAGLVINALAIKATAGMMPDVLYVRSFGSAFIAALVMVVCNYLLHAYLI